MNVAATPSGDDRAPLCVAITTGEPAGVGPELTAAALAEAATRWPDARFVVLGDGALLAARARCVQAASCCVPLFQNPRHNQIRIEHVPLAVPAHAGRLDAANGRYVLVLLDRAIEGALAGEFDAIVTAPLQKSTINDAGIPFSGHTEYLAARTGTVRVVMMLAGNVGGNSGVHSSDTHSSVHSGVGVGTHSGVHSSVNVGMYSGGHSGTGVGTHPGVHSGAGVGTHSGVHSGANVGMHSGVHFGGNVGTHSGVHFDANAGTYSGADAGASGVNAGAHMDTSANIRMSSHAGFHANPRVTASAFSGASTPGARALRVALATTHLPLKDVPAALTVEGLVQTLRIIDHDLRAHFGVARPRILVTGLNPHAGENGYLGREEIDVIAPALAIAAAQGIDARGPYPADTLFQPRHLNDADCVLAMFHDQGLPVLKYATFGAGINVTLGLPIVRTSVDHGTALDLAGTGCADAGSLIAALDAAVLMARHRRRRCAAAWAT